MLQSRVKQDRDIGQVPRGYGSDDNLIDDYPQARWKLIIDAHDFNRTLGHRRVAFKDEIDENLVTREEAMKHTGLLDT